MIINPEMNTKIYNSLGDELSRKTFLARLQFSSCPCDDTLAGLIASYAPNFVSEVRSHIAAGRKIAVYGAGDIQWHPGRMVYQMFESHACGLFDKNAGTLGDIRLQNFSNCCYFDDPKRIVTVQSPDKIKEHLPDVAVIICVFNRDFQLEIFNECLRLGVKQENILFCSQLFDIFYRHEYFFMPFQHFGSDEVLIDCGCFDAEDTINFIKTMSRYGGKSQVIAFEPSRRNFSICRQNLAQYPNVNLVNACVGAENRVTYFREDTANAFWDRMCDGNGSYQADVLTIDSIAETRHITFIKMDIEGAELAALKGAENTIRRCKPKLAICLYHKYEDIVEVPAWLVNLDIGYRLYIRHHSFNATETILYAV